MTRRELLAQLPIAGIFSVFFRKPKEQEGLLLLIPPRYPHPRKGETFQWFVPHFEVHDSIVYQECNGTVMYTIDDAFGGPGVVVLPDEHTKRILNKRTGKQMRSMSLRPVRDSKTTYTPLSSR